MTDKDIMNDLRDITQDYLWIFKILFVNMTLEVVESDGILWVSIYQENLLALLSKLSSVKIVRCMISCSV